MNQNGNSSRLVNVSRSADYNEGAVFGAAAALAGVGAYLLVQRCVKWARDPQSRPSWLPGHQAPAPPLGEVWYPPETAAGSSRQTSSTADTPFRYFPYSASAVAQRLLLKREAPPPAELSSQGFFDRMSKHAQKYLIPEPVEATPPGVKRVRFADDTTAQPGPSTAREQE